MDSHTLNAWTRFALQKGGIGSCTARIDNPATEPEDLMFMTGEKIIVLRRLDEEGAEGARPNSMSKRRSNLSDSDSWFLGYCEGVVGRFKGAHVEFHGKLKKPVLMRRSGTGSIRESSKQPMSKQEAASLHASQVPPGIPVTSVNSDGEEDSEMGHSSSTRNGSGGNRDTSNSVNSRGGYSNVGTRGGYSQSGSSNGGNGSPMKSNQGASRSNAAAAEASRRNLGVSTPPLSDETHARSRLDDSDSDDSETLLPWARPRVPSDDESEGSRARSEPSHITRNNSSSVGHGALGPAGLNPSHLPPSPISSAESPITHNDSSTARTPTARRPQPSGRINNDPQDSPNSGQSSRTTSMTSDSDQEDDQARGGGRGDYTFSIYDVYGRDSVAFPNFILPRGPEVSSRGNGVSSRDSPPSLKVDTQMRGNGSGSAGSTPEPNTPRERDQGRGNQNGSSSSQPRQNIPTNLRSPSGRRPSAAPDPRAASPGLNLASSLRKNLEGAPAPGSGGVPALPEGSSYDNQQQPQRGPGNFDPRRRPSAANVNGPLPPNQQRRPGPPNGPPQRGMSSNTSAPNSPALGQGQMGPGGFVPGQLANLQNGSPAFGPSSGPSLRPGMQRPGMADSMRRRSQSVSNVNLNLANGGPPSSINDPNNLDFPSPRSPFGPNAPGLRSSGASGGPMRSSSDRSSERERTGSKELKKNPSNPQPGLHGGMSGLSVAYPSRSPSPLTNASESNGRLSPGARSSPGDVQGRGGSPLGGVPPPQQIRMPPVGFRGPPGGPGTPSSLGGGPPYPGGPGQMAGNRAPSQPEGPVAFDALGFVIGSGPTFPPQPEDPEAREKWSQVLAENDLAAVRKSRKVKKMIQTGVPAAFRGRVWLFLANSYVRRRPGLFEKLVKTSQESKGRKGREVYYEAIEKDLDRCFPEHKLFRGEESTGRADLEAILKAYVHYNPIIGYTQGMGMLVGILLIHMPAEDAFWLLCALLREPHMEGYYANELKQLHVDGVVFDNLLATMDPELHQRLTSLGIECSNFTPNWFLPLFVRVIPWATLMRVWDIFFFEGPVWILRVALAIIRIIREPLMSSRACPDHAAAMQILLHPPQINLTPGNVLACAFSVKLKDGEIRKLSRNASKLVRQNMQSGVLRGRSANRNSAPAARSLSAPAKKH